MEISRHRYGCQLEDGSVTWLQCTFRLIVVCLMLMVVLLVVMAHQADEDRREEHEDERLKEGDEDFHEGDQYRGETTDHGNRGDRAAGGTLAQEVRAEEEQGCEQHVCV